MLVIYCGYNDAKSQSIDNLIAALIKQILQIRPNVSKELKELYNTHSRTDVFPSLKTLTNILHTEIAKFDNCFIIVDALDEIVDEPKRLLLLETLVHGKVNVMVTSRPIDSIRDLFSLITDISCTAVRKRTCGWFIIANNAWVVASTFAKLAVAKN